MAKLIGHYFSVKAGGFSTFEVGPLKETEKQYKKTKETTDGAPRGSYDYWNVIPKSELGQLRRPGNGCFTMYELESDLAGFKALVVKWLEQTAESARQRYSAALSMLESARTLVPKEFGAVIDGESSRRQDPVPRDAAIPVQVLSEDQPLVTVIYSEHKGLRDIKRMPLYLADALFSEADAIPRERRGVPFYHTDFMIDFVWRGEKHSYAGHYDVGDGSGSLTDQIQEYADGNLTVARQNILDEDTVTDLQFISEKVIPSFRKHNELSALEADALSELMGIHEKAAGSPPDTDAPRIAYLESVVAYAVEARDDLITLGLRELPEPPRPFASVPANEKTGKPSVLGQLRNGNPPGKRQDRQPRKKAATSRE